MIIMIIHKYLSRQNGLTAYANIFWCDNCVEIHFDPFYLDMFPKAIFKAFFSVLINSVYSYIATNSKVIIFLWSRSTAYD